MAATEAPNATSLQRGIAARMLLGVRPAPVSATIRKGSVVVAARRRDALGLTAVLSGNGV
ncbi:hypothetical protein [Streptomyces sp. NPDC002164]|uniref:hypothetical protein n=1 Tax=unclassified Streptomyces TaxID=2593676 RepID=UPI00367BF2FD